VFSEVWSGGIPTAASVTTLVREDLHPPVHPFFTFWWMPSKRSRNTIEGGRHGMDHRKEIAIIKLNHLNLAVTDVAQTRKLFETYFGFTALKEVGNDKFTLMFGEDGFVLNLMRGSQVSYPETFHIGFMQESEERVNEINRHLKEDGFDVNPPGKSHGAWTFYFRAPGGITIEVLHQPGAPT
jgi:lactoylglutathione lyase